MANRPTVDIINIFAEIDIEAIPHYNANEAIQVSEHEVLPKVFVLVDENFDEIPQSTNNQLRSVVVTVFIFANSSNEVLNIYESILNEFFLTENNQYGLREAMPIDLTDYAIHHFEPLGNIEWSVEKYGIIFMKECVFKMDYTKFILP
jgi:hypothetical protein